MNWWSTATSIFQQERPTSICLIVLPPLSGACPLRLMYTRQVYLFLSLPFFPYMLFKWTSGKKFNIGFGCFEKVFSIFFFWDITLCNPGLLWRLGWPETHLQFPPSSGIKGMHHHASLFLLSKEEIKEDNTRNFNKPDAFVMKSQVFLTQPGI